MFCLKINSAQKVLTSLVVLRNFQLKSMIWLTCIYSLIHIHPNSKVFDIQAYGNSGFLIEVIEGYT